MTTLEFGSYNCVLLKKEFPESFFLRAEFDPAIMGINAHTNSIIYHETEMIYIVMDELKNNFDGDLVRDGETEKWNNFYDECMLMVHQTFEELASEEIPPTLFHPID
jgi:glucosamine 6-phosphate synthetase-like amidotransferase/phosphosugar isomerase protein